MIIRQETAKDRNTVYQLVKEAFRTAKHAAGNEHTIVAQLRDTDAFIPELSLVAEIDGAIAGHTLFSKGYVGDEPVLILGPVSVVYSMRGHGTGGAMIREGHRIAKELGYNYVTVYGSNLYYPMLGYKPAHLFNIEVPEGLNPAHYMVLKLNPDAPAISGKVKYPEPFGV